MGGRLTKRTVEGALPSEKATFLWDAGDGAVKGFGCIVNPSGRRVFVAQFRIRAGASVKSRRVTIGPFGPWTVEQARDRAKELIREASLGIDRGAESEAQAALELAQRQRDEADRRATRAARMDRLAAAFMRRHIRPKRKANTIALYHHLISRYIFPTFANRDAREISRADVSRWHAGMSAIPATANRALAALSAIYGWAGDEGLIPVSQRRPTYKVEKFRERAKERYLSADELRRLGDAIRLAETRGIAWAPRSEGKVKHAPKAENRHVKVDTYSAAAIRLLLFTGCRLREILDLQWTDVDLERGLLRLRDSKTGAKAVLLNAPARDVLLGMERIGRFVIKGDGDRVRTDLKRPWRLVCRAAGLEDVRIHDLRHSFASVGAGDGLGLLIVGKLLGHSQASTTQRYAHLDADPLRKASDTIAQKIAQALGEVSATQPASKLGSLH